ncbi:cysteine desulfurase family protein [Microbacterium sp. zg-Y818]|uniref:cysteine desulfurase family protein n=1 Tax=unclassified Microbacterium TaxID=2609290 RepID=UPI00214C56DF|nr:MULTISPECIES: cysteine desulfurase family protein [unclassified Microbacterium]MCR2801050.1 cysteine desulfurase [Microbacterium sp. zg.Y818]WIM23755.1 cysteine desulfurase family protein [Microbacterium sp. zg-Y818]
MSVYLDHAATTPLRPEARDAWVAASATVGNPSSIHGGGQAARRVLEDARERIAAALHADPIEVVFTSGGTESVNLAIKGLWWARAAGAQAVVLPDGEHHATLDTVAWLNAHQGAEVRAVPLHPTGAIDTDAFAAALPGAALATALVANNEVGTVNDVVALAAASATAGVPLHLDAVGAFGHLDVDFALWRGDASGAAGLSTLSVSAHKVGGPVGIGALVVSRHVTPAALLHGGGQQRGLRSGTQDVAGAAAFAVAAELAVAERESEAARLGALRDRLVDGIRHVVPEAQLLGDPLRRLPGNAHLLFPGVAGETLLFLLDQQGIAVSTGSACQAGVPEPSHVVRALGRSDDEARSVLRVSLGRTTTAADVDALLAALPEAHTRAAAAGARARARS